MRKSLLLRLLLLVLLLGACGDLTGLGGRSVDGEWSARIEGEDVWLSLRDDGQEIWGSGEWGFDKIRVDGERFGSDVRLQFEFYDFTPIEFEGTVRGTALEGQLYGSGYRGERVRFYRE